MTQADRHNADACWDAALDWLFWMNANPGDADVQKRLNAWLSADARHAAAFAEARSVWNVAGALPTDDESVPPVPAHVVVPSVRPRLQPSQLLRSRVRGGAVLAIAAAFLIVLLAPHLYLWARSDALTGAAEVRSVVLPDASRVVLSPHSAIAIDEGFATARGVTLLRGEAYFEVAHDPKRQFIVRAGAACVRVLGTGFDVRRIGDEVIVGVRHGHVAVELEGVETVRAELTAGQQARIHLTEGRLTQSALSVRAIGAWQDGRLEVSDWTLGELAHELERYRTGFIVVDDATLARARVAGVYHTDDPELALGTAAHLHGARVRHLTPWLLWVTKDD